MSDETKKALSTIGKLGGQATKKKYGKVHYRKIAEKRWAKPEVSCETCNDTEEVLSSHASVVAGDIQDEVISSCPDCTSHGDPEAKWSSEL